MAGVSIRAGTLLLQPPGKRTQQSIASEGYDAMPSDLLTRVKGFWRISAVVPACIFPRCSWQQTTAALLSLQLGWGLWLFPSSYARLGKPRRGTLACVGTAGWSLAALHMGCHSRGFILQQSPQAGLVCCGKDWVGTWVTCCRRPKHPV